MNKYEYRLHALLNAYKQSIPLTKEQEQIVQATCVPKDDVINGKKVTLVVIDDILQDGHELHTQLEKKFAKLCNAEPEIYNVAYMGNFTDVVVPCEDTLPNWQKLNRHYGKRR